MARQVDGQPTTSAERQKPSTCSPRMQALAAGLALMSELGRRERAVMRMDNTINGVERIEPATGWEARVIENGLFAVAEPMQRRLGD